jgi:WD40 repeat protein
MDVEFEATSFPSPPSSPSSSSSSSSSSSFAFSRPPLPPLPSCPLPFSLQQMVVTSFPVNEGDEAYLFHLLVSASGGRLVTSDSNGFLRVYDSATLNQIGQVNEGGKKRQREKLCFVLSLSLSLSLSLRGLSLQIEAHSQKINDVVFTNSDSENFVLSASDDSTVRLTIGSH